MFKAILSILCLTAFGFGVMAQEATNLIETHPDAEFENVTVKKLSTDPRSTSFLIWVKDGVKPHYHAKHSETIYVLEGSADMILDGKKYQLSPGDFVHIPMNSVHSVKVTSEEPAKVLSIQAPEFFGKDRIWVEKEP